MLPTRVYCPLIASLLVFCIPGLSAAAQDGELRALSERVRPSVVEIIGTVQATGDTSYGTGFVVEDSGLVITNAHVVRGVSEAMVRSFEGALIASVDVLHVDEEVDLAVLRVLGLHVKPLFLAKGPIPAVGSEVVAVGHPRGYEFTVSNGIVSALRALEKGGVELIQTTTPISPGSSGGPLLDLQGRVVGVCSLTLTEGQNINFAVPARELRPVIDKALAVEKSLAAGSESGLPADALVRLVKTHREKGEFTRAGELVHKALGKHPRNLDLLAEAAEIAWSTGNYQEVDSLVDRMEAISPEFAPGRQIRAAYLAQTGRCEDAVRVGLASLKGALNAQQTAEAHAVLAECLGRLGRVDEALSHIEKALLSGEISSLPDYHVLHAFLLQSAGRIEEAHLAAVVALQAGKWDPLILGALRERGLPHLLDILSFKGGARGEHYEVHGVIRNAGPIPLEEILVTAEGFDAEEQLVATGTITVVPLKLVPGQTGAFEISLSGSPEDVESVAVRVVDYRE